MGERHPNLDFARRLWAAIADGDAERLRELLADEVVWLARGHNPLSGEHRGPEAVLDYFARAGELTDEFRGTLNDLFVNDRGVVVLYRISASRGVKRLESDFTVVMRIRDGKLIHALHVPHDQQENDKFWN